MQTRQAVLEIRAVVGNVQLDLLAELLAGLHDDFVTPVGSHRLGRVIRVAACAVPVALHRLRLERDDHAVFLGDAVKQVTGHVQVVAHLEQTRGTDLELPLAGHDLRVDSCELETRRQAGIDMIVGNFAAENAIRAGTAVVGALGSRVTAVGETGGVSLDGHHRVFLLDSEPGILGFELRSGFHRGRAIVGVTRTPIGVVDLAQDEQAIAPAQRVGAGEHGFQHAVRGVPFGLLRGRPIETPNRGLFALGENLRLGS